MAGRSAGKDKGAKGRSLGKRYFAYRWPAPTSRTPKRDETFLEQLRLGTSVSGAAIAAGYTRSCVYGYRKKDPAFADAWDDAEQSGTDVFDDAATERGVHGVEKPVFHQGKIVGHVREYSDMLLALKLKGRRPEVYRENVNMAMSGQLQVQVVNYATKKEGE